MLTFFNQFQSIEDYQRLLECSLDKELVSALAQYQPDFFRIKGASYTDQQKHSKLIDNLYGFEIESVEEMMKHRSLAKYHDYEIWSGLAPEQLQTPYDELRRVLRDCNFQDGESLVDLGAGYGRVGVILGEKFPNSSFTGIEIASERVVEGNRIFKEFGFINCELIAAEAQSMDIAAAKVYFIYDFGLPSQIEQTLSKIAERAFKEEFYVVARGRGVRSIVNYKFPQLWSAFTPLHGETYSIYSTFCDLE